MQDQLRAAMGAIKGIKIPDLPKEVLELDQALASKFPNNQDITDIIKSNTKLSGEVLRIVNSPAMKVKSEVKTIRDAVENLGHKNLKNLVLASAMKNIFNKREVNEIIEHSKDVAFCCAELSDHVHGVSRDQAYLAGLFHNAGGLLLATKDPEHYVKMFSQLNTRPVSAMEKEHKAYGANHTYIGVLMGQKWRLGVDVLNAIVAHHAPIEGIKSDSARTLVAMIKIANVVVNEISYGSFMTQEAKDYLKEGREELMLDYDDIDDVRKALATIG